MRSRVREKFGSRGVRANLLAGVTPSEAAIVDAAAARGVAHFHPLVTQSIDTLSYRQYNYHLMMSHSTQLARWLHKMLSFHLRGAPIEVLGCGAPIPDDNALGPPGVAGAFYQAGAPLKMPGGWARLSRDPAAP